MKNTNRLVQTACFLWLAVSLSLVGCSKKDALQLSPMPDFRETKSEPVVEKPKDPPVRYESLGDKETFTLPRIQFIGQIKGSGDYSILSMRFDGSDKRVVATPDQLFYTGIAHTPIRSPNNRYIAVSLSGDDGPFRILVDLLKMTSIRITDGGGHAFFNWTEDSENLIFYNDGSKLLNYHVPSGKLTERPMIYSGGLFLLPGDKAFLAFKFDGYWIHRMDGTLVRKVKLKIREGNDIAWPQVSPDGKWLFFTESRSDATKVYFVDIATGEMKVRERKEVFYAGGAGAPMFYYEPDSFFYVKGKNHILKSFSSGRVTKLERKERWIWDVSRRGMYSLMNYSSYKK